MWLIILCCAVGLSESYNISTVQYLQRFGYLDVGSGNDDQVKNALIILQEKYNLPVDGLENVKTLQLITGRRCGVVDNFMPFMVNSNKFKWAENNLTWYIYPPQYSPIAERAFSIWSKHANLNFIRSSISPNISIAFVAGKHLCITNTRAYCYAAFDGEGGVIAHAEFPIITRQKTEIHFDEAEKWCTTDTLPSGSDEVSLYTVLIHEIGHALGLHHTNDENSLMYGVYKFPQNVSSLDEIDLNEEEINAIQMLYGAPSSPIPTTTVATPRPTHKAPTQVYMDLCNYRRKIESVLVANKRVYFFYRNYVWAIPLLESTRLKRDYVYPMQLNRWLKFLPSNFTKISAIYQRPNKDIVMFANDKMYMFNFPYLHLIFQDDISSIITDTKYTINAALHSNTGKTYIIYNRNFVNEFDECNLSSNFVGDVATIFPGVPRNVETSFQHTNGRLYFKSNNIFYSYDEFLESVTETTLQDPTVLYSIVCDQSTILQQLQKLLNKFMLNLQLDDEIDE